MAAAALVGSNLRKVYGHGSSAVPALRGCDIVVAEGEMVAIMGRSGSGKSTLLHVLSGLEDASSGDVSLLGRQLSELSEAERARLRARKLGFVLQRDNLIPSLTIEENVATPLLFGDMPRREAFERAARALADVGLDNKARAWPADVSGGEAQRAAVARACAGDPAVIFADEPTGALDSESGARVLDLFQTAVAATGAAVLLVTHEPAVSERADRILRMCDGTLSDGLGG